MIQAPNLPQELLDQIIDFAAVECENRDLYACSLAGWPLLIRSRSYLFRHIQLQPYSEKSTLGLLRALEGDPPLLECGKGWRPLASCIRSLELIPWEGVAASTVDPTLARVLEYLLHVETFKLNFKTTGTLFSGWSFSKNGLRLTLLAFCSCAPLLKKMTFINISDLPPQIIFSCPRLEHLTMENTFRPLPPRPFPFDPKDLPRIQFLEIDDESLDFIASSSNREPQLLPAFSRVRVLETEYALRLSSSIHRFMMAFARSLYRLRLVSPVNSTYDSPHPIGNQVDLGRFTSLAVVECRYWLMAPTRSEFSAIWTLFKQVTKPTVIEKIEIQLDLEVGHDSIEDEVQKMVSYLIWPQIDGIFTGPLFPSLKNLCLNFHISCTSHSDTSIRRTGEEHQLEAELEKSYRMKLPKTFSLGILNVACTVVLDQDFDL